MAKKGQTFTTYTEELKREVARLRLEEGWSYRQLRERFGIKSDAQIVEWIRKVQNKESFEDRRGVWNRKHFSSIEEENAYLKAQVDYPKKAQSQSTREGVVLKKERFHLIDTLRTKHPLAWLLKIGEVSKAGYYKWRKNRSTVSARVEEKVLLKEHILAIYKVHPYFGYKRMTQALSREGIEVNHKRVLKSVIRKKRPFYGRRGSVVFANVLNREFYAENPFEKLVTDITYVRIGETFAYLSVIMDLYNNEIVAWEFSERNDLELVIRTLEQLKEKVIEKKALLHSDQGFQYTTKSYEQRLEELKIQGSHSRRGNGHDNACIESFFSHLKTEKLYLVHPKTAEHAYQAINEYMDFYNHERFQEKFNGLSPIEYREKAVA
ncbi:IS3 family transposase [Priestia megaterium]|nr:IS3 family transposase [Priestia megaterium]